MRHVAMTFVLTVILDMLVGVLGHQDLDAQTLQAFTQCATSCKSQFTGDVLKTCVGSCAKAPKEMPGFLQCVTSCNSLFSGAADVLKVCIEGCAEVASGAPQKQ